MRQGYHTLFLVLTSWMMKYLQHLIALLLRLETVLGEALILLKVLAEQRKQLNDPPPPAEKMWMDAQDVKEMLHVSDRTLQRLRSTGELPCSRLNGKIYYKRSDIMGLLEKNYS